MVIGTVLFLFCVCPIWADDYFDQADEEFGFEDATENGNVSLGQFIGDPCEDRCSDDLTHSFCNKSSKRCECDTAHPVVFNNHICLAPVSLGEVCNHGESCSYYDSNAICAKISQYYYRCSCKAEYQQSSSSGRSRCVPAKKDMNGSTDVPTVLGVGLGMGLFTALTCLVLRLFSNARFGQPRGHFADANLPPPITLTNTPAPPSRRSSGPSSYPSSRRPSYTMLAPPSFSGSRRPSSGSIRSQISVRSYTGNRAERPYHEPLRPTLSAPTPEMSSPSRLLGLSPRRGELKIPIYSEVVTEEKDASDETNSPSHLVQIVPPESSGIRHIHV